MMKRSLVTAALSTVALLTTGVFADEAPAFRPSAVPLIVHDPYLSIWSTADKLTDDVTRHWTRSPTALIGLLRVDGETLRVIGNAPESAPALPQTSTKVTPARTIATYANDKIKLTLTFLSPAIPSDLDLLSMPITYVIYEVSSADGKPHDVTAFFSCDAEMARNDDHQSVKVVKSDAKKIIKLGREDQETLERRGDGVRIDWGYACLGGSGEGLKLATGERAAVTQAFVDKGELPATTELAEDAAPALGATLSFGKVSGTAPVTRHVLIGYDDDKAINYMGSQLDAYWKRDGMTIDQAFDRFEKEMPAIQKASIAFDEKLTKSLTDVGGEKYAAVATLAHRQSLGACKVVADANKMPLMFSKEITSNGCIATVDVFFPQIPHLLLLDPELAKATALPILDYANSPRWAHAYAPHDLGTYPQATGQVYGGGEKSDRDQMPVEECGNMLLVVGGISKADGDAKFADKYWPLLTKWAKYLEANGVDPENQLCTDDFAGHIARNANLSVKAIMAMGAYAMMADMRGEKDTATHFRDFARASAKKWMKMADAGDHYGLVFDKPETWSQKYNLVWDDVLDMDLFPKEVKAKELAYYKTKLNEFGLPLDSRRGYTKSDWSMWTATLADDKQTFELFSDLIYKRVNETKDRTPMSDWYETENTKVVGFIARPVVGGLFMPMLKDDKVWASWAKQAPVIKGDWAKMPVPPPPPKTVAIIPTSEQNPQQWMYLTEKPADDWAEAKYDDHGWKKGQGGFGTPGTPNAKVKTTWNTDDIWLRRKITIPANAGNDLMLSAHHDEDLDVYIDGKRIAHATGFTADYSLMKLKPESIALLTPGEHTLAVHCHQTQGGQYVDVGIVKVVK